MTEELRFIQGPDGEHYISVRDLVSALLAVHDHLTDLGEESVYNGIATSLAIPFMELDGVTPEGATVLHISPGGSGADR